MKLGFLTVLVALVAGVSSASAQACDPPRIMLSVDKSFSMVKNGSTKWDDAKAAIEKIALDHHAEASFGVQTFPAGKSSCDEGEIRLELGNHSAEAIVESLGERPENGNMTPAAQALGALLNNEELSDADLDRHVIFITDGWQDCPGTENDSRVPAIEAAGQLREAGITVHFVGFGDSVDSLMLNRAAVAAGTAIQGCEPTLAEPMASGHCYLVASDAQGIQDVLSEVTNQITQEVCDGFDNDCDGRFDEDYDQDDDRYTTCGSVSDEGGAPSDALADCDDSNPNVNVEAEEVCDGIDNDCDGMIDNGCECTLGEQQPCGSAEGACTQGRQFCGTTGWGDECIDEVAPSEELCDLVDNDCDAELDEDALCADGGTCWEGVCQPPGDAGCGCHVGVSPKQLFGWGVLVLGVALSLARRRRQR